MKNLVTATTIIAGLTASAAGSQTARLPACPLDPGLLAVQERCTIASLESAPAFCKASRILEHLARGDATAAEAALTRDFALPEASSKRMMPWLGLLGSALVDLDSAPPECTQEQARRVLEIVRGDLFESLEQSETLVLLGHTLDWPETLTSPIKERLEPAVVTALRNLGRAIGELPSLTAGQLESSPRRARVEEDFPPPHPLDGDEETRRVVDLAGEPDTRTREDRILRHIELGVYRDAIREISAWELEVESGRPSSVYESGSFRSRALNLTFQVPGEWEPIDLSDEESLAKIRTLGSSLELLLKNEEPEAMFMFMSTDVQRTVPALRDEPGEVFTDEMLFNQVRTSAAQFSGIFSSHEFMSIKGNDRALIAKILGPGEQFIVHLALLPDGSRLHIMMLISMGATKDATGDPLREILRTVELDHGEVGTSLDQDLVGNARESQQPAAVLKAVRDLLARDQAELAASELAWLRQHLAAAIPGPRAEGNTVRWATYGISVENPDPESWNLELHREPPWGTAIFLTEGELEEGLAVMVNDTLATTPALASWLKDPSKDTRMLAEVAQRMAQEMGGEIADQEFTTLHGRLAYQVTLAPMAGGLRARLLLQSRDDYLVGVILIAKSEGFDHQVERYETILRGRWIQLGR